MSKKKILIVDDEPDILKLMEWQLMMSGYDVITADNGTEGFEKARELKPDLIILDVLMPIHQVNGLQMNELLKKNEVTKEIPVIFVTNTADEDEQVDDEGNVMFSKAVSAQRMLSKIKELIED